MDSALPRTEVAEQCPERERLLREWTQCGRQVAKLFAEQSGGAPNSAFFEEHIRLARAAEAEACRKYFGHVNKHDCV
jgi:hypothetical protein